MTQEKLRENLYNTDDLMFASYEYAYTFPYYDSIGENIVTVKGTRTGIVYYQNEDYIDLISGINLSEENIIGKTSLAVKDTILSLEDIKGIFKTYECAGEYLAHEVKVDRTYRMGHLFSCVPSKVSFKASEEVYGIIMEFERNANILESNNEPKCELDRMIQKVKSKFRRNN